VGLTVCSPAWHALPGPGRISGYKILCAVPQRWPWDAEHDHAVDEIRHCNIDSAGDREVFSRRSGC
jgi:hypothetical protein